MNILQFVVVGSLAAVCSAHMCLLNPIQRGTAMGINKAGAPDCALTMGPCGGRMAGMDSVTYKKGQNVTVVIQKNLDHWVMATPGNFKVNLMREGSTMPVASAMVKDAGEPSLSLYSVNMMIPMATMNGKYMIQAIYNTMNPNAPPMFYQCADVMIH